MTGAGDAVLERRRRIATAVRWGQRLGYGCFGAAMALFAVGAAIGFTVWVTAAVTALLLVGSFVLAPAIVFHYGLRAAERDEREGGRPGGSR